MSNPAIWLPLRSPTTREQVCEAVVMEREDESEAELRSASTTTYRPIHTECAVQLPFVSHRVNDHMVLVAHRLGLLHNDLQTCLAVSGHGGGGVSTVLLRSYDSSALRSSKTHLNVRVLVLPQPLLVILAMTGPSLLPR